MPILFDKNTTFISILVAFLDWPLNVYTYNSYQKYFSKDVCKILQSYTVAWVSILTSK